MSELFKTLIISYSKFSSFALLTENLIPLKTEDGQELQKENVND